MKLHELAMCQHLAWILDIFGYVSRLPVTWIGDKKQGHYGFGGMSYATYKQARVAWILDTVSGLAWLGVKSASLTDDQSRA
jgi:hypothetical protein